MIQNGQEYEFSKRHANDRNSRITAYRRRFTEEGLFPEQIERAVAPIISFNLGIHAEVTDHESKNESEA